MRKLFNNKYLVSMFEFIARLCLGALWGLFLSPHDLDTRPDAFITACIGALFFSNAFFAWDWQGRLHATRLGLYAMYVVGEALCVGSVVLTALASFLGLGSYLLAAIIALWAGYNACMYAMVSLAKLHIQHQ